MLQTLKRMQEAGENEDPEGLEGGSDYAEEEGGGNSDMETEEEGGFEMSEETLRRLSEKGERVAERILFGCAPRTTIFCCQSVMVDWKSPVSQGSVQLSCYTSLRCFRACYSAIRNTSHWSFVVFVHHRKRPFLNLLEGIRLASFVVDLRG